MLEVDSSLLKRCEYFTRKKGRCKMLALPHENYCPPHLEVVRRWQSRWERTLTYRLLKELLRRGGG